MRRGEFGAAVPGGRVQGAAGERLVRPSRAAEYNGRQNGV